jgi:hypothetical protein
MLDLPHFVGVSLELLVARNDIHRPKAGNKPGVKLLAAAKRSRFADLAAASENHEAAELETEHRPSEGIIGEIEGFVPGVAWPKVRSEKNGIEIAESYEFSQSIIVADKVGAIALG